LVARSELRTRTALLLEAIALRHQIAVLERSRTRRPCFRRFDRLFWILLSWWWPLWRESLLIVQPETANEPLRIECRVVAPQNLIRTKSNFLSCAIAAL